MSNPVYAVYIANAESKSILALRFDSEHNTLTELQTLALPGNAQPMAMRPDQQMLVAGLRPVPFQLSSFAIATDGQLQPVASANLPGSPTYLSFDQTGRWVFMASYANGLVSVSPVATDGQVAAPVTTIETGPNAHAARIDATNRWLLVPVLGADRIRIFDFDASSGQLNPHEPSHVMTRQGAGPRHLVFSSDQTRVYCLNELDGVVDVFAFAAATGNLKYLQSIGSIDPDCQDRIWTADIHMTPDDRWLFTCDRTSNRLTCFAVSPEGKLSVQGYTETESQPRGFTISPCGQFLLIAGQTSNQLSLYSIGSDGSLQRLHRHKTGKNPIWIEMRPLAA